ncbi:MAG: hypothetical protein ABIC68_05535 [Candidatus Omnitrophota bacterium]
MPVKKRKKTLDLDFQMEFYEKILSEKTDFVEVMIALGEIYTKKGFYEKGLKLDKRLAQLRPDNPTIHYNLACSLSLTKDVDAALRAIEQAICLGYRDLAFMNRDPDLENVRQDKRYDALVKKTMRKRITIGNAKTR